MVELSFCNKCGQKLVDGVCPSCSSAASVSSAAPSSNSQDQRFKNFFMNPKEKLVCVLGNSYVQNFLSTGGLFNGFSVVSDKRVYFKGNTYWIQNGRPQKMREAKTVDLKDVTGTGQRTFTKPGFIALAILLGLLFIIIGICIASGDRSSSGYGYRISNGLGTLGGVIITFGVMFAVLFTILFFVTRITLITIEFAGGCIAFNVRWFPHSEVDNFQRQLRIAKDRAIEEAEQASANAIKEAMASAVTQQAAPAPAAAPVSSADELKKYAELFKDGLITEEEYQTAKERILSK